MLKDRHSSGVWYTIRLGIVNIVCGEHIRDTQGVASYTHVIHIYINTARESGGSEKKSKSVPVSKKKELAHRML